ncbi:MAG: hypothetical protein O3B72_11755 [Proteobacteria bacterium]|nr:hypothetical protein [Pseudomonadota bacterium]
MKRLMSFAGLMLVTSFALAGIKYSENSVGANKALPNNIVERLLDETSAEQVLATPYTGFYEIGAKVRDNSFSFERVDDKESFPGDMYEPLALDLVNLLNIPAYDTGTRIKPRATAYVVLFREGIDTLNIDPKRMVTLPSSAGQEPNTVAMIIIRQKDTSNASSDSYRSDIQRGNRDGNSVYFFRLAT